MADGVSLTWLGHAATKIEMGDGSIILIDPWVNTNPSVPEASRSLDRVDLMLISHGHDDNMGDAVEIGKQTQPHVIAMNEICQYLTQKGLKSCSGGNTGGTQEWNGVRVTLVNAIHSSSFQDGEVGPMLYGGLAVGFVLRFPDGFTLYHAGDTALFEDMRLIGRLYAPDAALLPIGDHFTMGPREAAEAIRLLDVRRVIPIHHGTFPALTGTPEQLQREARDISGLRIIPLRPGESVKQHQLIS